MTMVVLLSWSVLFLIGVSDAREHRIPNQLLLALLLITTLGVILNPAQTSWFEVFSDKTTGFVLCFTVGLLLYLMRVMAAGDVKLIAVLGFILGLDPLPNYVFYACLSTAFIGSMYWMLNKLPSSLSSLANQKSRGGFSLLALSAAVYLGGEGVRYAVVTKQGLTYMPFAPILIIGLAMHQYFSY
ncbi:prepilin peptidase [Vibrio nereis]|uniref:prepilin peptidase n=1 Tax=Vibrio nereis TaxID=693 RepID=UPI002494E8A1|nr:A24 family peptidase [Vibrio nereis]